MMRNSGVSYQGVLIISQRLLSPVFVGGDLSQLLTLDGGDDRIVTFFTI